MGHPGSTPSVSGKPAALFPRGAPPPRMPASRQRKRSRRNGRYQAAASEQPGMAGAVSTPRGHQRATPCRLGVWWVLVAAEECDRELRSTTGTEVVNDSWIWIELTARAGPDVGSLCLVRAGIQQRDRRLVGVQHRGAEHRTAFAGSCSNTTSRLTRYDPIAMRGACECCAPERLRRCRATCSTAAGVLYLFLVTVADAQGLSYYGAAHAGAAAAPERRAAGCGQGAAH